MKAVVKIKKGLGLNVIEVPYPKLNSQSAIVKVAACGICGADLESYLGRVSKYANLPMIFGHEYTGEIAEMGEEAKGFKVGEKVVVQPFIGMCGECYYCKIGETWSCSKRRIMGGMAEYAAVPIRNIYPIPKNYDIESAALCEPFAVALHAIHMTAFKVLDTAVVLGSGPIGLMTTLALKIAGASLIVITGLRDDVSPRLELAAKVGADAVVNVEETNPVDTVIDMTKGL